MPLPAAYRNRQNVRAGESEQAAFVTWCRMQRQKWPELALLFAIPNGSYLAGSIKARAAQAARLTAGGMRKGVPDFFLPVAQGCFHGLFIEMKSGKGKATPEQKQWISDLRNEGYRAEVVNGWQAGAELVKGYMEAG